MSDLTIVCDTTAKPAAPKAPLRLKQKRSKWTPRPRPLDRSSLDGRTVAARVFDQLKREIVAELGGDISRIEDGIVDGYIGALVGVRGDLTRLVRGEAVDWAEYCGKLSTMVRAASRLQPWRRLKLIDRPPSLEEYSRQLKAAAVTDGEAQ